MFVDIAIANTFLHYPDYVMMFLLGIPLYIGICVFDVAMEKTYRDQVALKLKLEDHLRHDELTGAYNRNVFESLVGENHTFICAKGEYMACMDADLQHPPIVLKYMYKAMLSGADFCIPSRLIPGGDDGGLNWYRKFVSGTARKIGQIMLPCLRKISDPTSGLFMFKREVIEHADLQPIGWKIMVEVLAMGTYSKVVEIPYKFQQRTEGESKLSGKVTLEYLKQLKNLRKRYNKNNKYEVEIWSTERMME